MPGLTLMFDVQDFGRVTQFIMDMGRRMSRAELLPILKEKFEPLVAMERSILSSHSKSGALIESLKTRSGGGDFPGTMSVFSAPTATRKALKAAWSRGRAQQQKWAAAIEPGRGRKSVFYGPFVEKGHRIVRRNKEGVLVDTLRRTAPVHFARGATEALGEKQSEEAAQAVIDFIIG